MLNIYESIPYCSDLHNSSSDSFVKTLNGTTVTVDVDIERDRISDIQDQLYTSYGTKPEHQLLTFCGKALQSDKQLSDYNIDAFCTLDLSLRLMSSKASPLTIHLPSSWSLKDYSIELHFNPQQSLLDLKRQIADVTHQNHTFNCFVHNGNSYQISDDITVNDIAHIWTDSTLHVSGVPSFCQAHSVEYVVQFDGSPICTINDPTISALPLDRMIRNAFASELGELHVDWSKWRNHAFAHLECPFGSVTVEYNGVSLLLQMSKSSKVAIPLNNENPVEDALSFGILPSMTLTDLKSYFPDCDCCRSKLKSIFDPLVIKRTVLRTSLSEPRPPCVKIFVELCTEPFLFEDQYYSNGCFYPRSRRRDILKLNSPVTDSRLFPIMPHPQCLSEELLVHGFMRKYYCWVPMELRMLISCFFPKLYAGRYDVKHNPTSIPYLQ